MRGHVQQSITIVRTKDYNLRGEGRAREGEGRGGEGEGGGGGYIIYI